MQGMCQNWEMIQSARNLVCVKESGREPQGWRGKQEPGPAASRWQTEEIALHSQETGSDHPGFVSAGMTVRADEQLFRMDERCTGLGAETVGRKLWQWPGQRG